MELTLIVCLLVAGAMLVVFRDDLVARGAVLGIFVGLVIISIYPSVPLIAKGINMELTLPTAVILIKELGWLFIMIPVSMFFLAYFKQLPMNLFILFKANLAFAFFYNVILGLMIFRSMRMMTLLVLSVFLTILFVMLGFSWVICYYQRCSDNWTPRSSGIDEKIDEQHF